MKNNATASARELVIRNAIEIMILFFGTNLIFQDYWALDQMAVGAVVILILNHICYWSMLGDAGLAEGENFSTFKNVPILEKVVLAIAGVWFTWRINTVCFNYLIDYTYLYAYTILFWICRILKWVMRACFIYVPVKCIWDAYIGPNGNSAAKTESNNNENEK